MTNKIVLITILINLSFFMFGQEKQSVKQSQWDTEIATARQLWDNGQKDSSFSRLLELVAREKELPKEIKWRVNDILANKLSMVGELHSSLEYEKKAFKTNPKRATNPNAGRAKLALAFKHVHQYDSAIHYTNLAMLHRSKGTTREDSLYFLFRNNDIGYYYYLKGDLDRAMDYYKVVVTDLNLKKFPGTYGLAIGNMAQIHFEKGDFHTALKFAKKELDLTKTYARKSYLITLILAARCNYQLNQLQEAEAYLETFFLTIKSNTETEQIKNAYELKAKIETKRNNFQEAYKAIYQSLMLSDSIEKQQLSDEQAALSFSNYRLESIQQKLELSKKEAALAKANEANRTAQVRFYLSLSIFGLLALSSLFFFYRLSRKRKEKLKELEHELLQSELENKRKDLTQFGLQLSNKQEFIHKMNGHLEEILKKPANEAHKNIQSLIHEFNHRSILDENLAVLRTDIEKVNNSFFEKLGNEFPELTRTEKEICGLLILNFSTKEIAQIRNVTSNAVKKKRQIIRKKLPISSDEDLTEFLLTRSKSIG